MFIICFSSSIILVLHMYGRGQKRLYIKILRDATLCFVETEALTSLSAQAASRLHQAFRPKTCGAYSSMFKIFVAFYIYCKFVLPNVNIKVILSFLECLVHNNFSVYMIENYESAIKANFVLYDLPYTVLEHPKLRYFIKALNIHHSLSLRPHNIITIPRLAEISATCENMTAGLVHRAVFLMGFFAILRLSNLAPNAMLVLISEGI